MSNRNTDTYVVPPLPATDESPGIHARTRVGLTLCFHPELERLGEVAWLDDPSPCRQIDRDTPLFHPADAPPRTGRGLDSSLVSNKYPLRVEAGPNGGLRLQLSAPRDQFIVELPERGLELGPQPVEISAEDLAARGVILVLNRTIVLLAQRVVEPPTRLDPTALHAEVQKLLTLVKISEVDAAIRGVEGRQAARLAWAARRIDEAARRLIDEAHPSQSAELVHRAGEVVRKAAWLDRQEHGVIGTSRALEALWTAIYALPPRGPVLILGEQGAGKSEVARAVARLNPRARPLQYKNAAGLISSVAAAELFGRKKGFLGADDQGALGLFRAADRGTLFLDEIGELPEDIQAKLLDAVERSCITPVGDIEVPIEVRLVTATNRDLTRTSFKKDLYDRLSGLQLRVPSLRERREDIPGLLVHFLREAWQGQLQRPPESKAVCGAWAGRWARFMVKLLTDNWPGNVRVFRDLVSRLALANPISLDPACARFVEPAWPEAQPNSRAPAEPDRTKWDEFLQLPTAQQRERLASLLAEHRSQVKTAAWFEVSAPTLNRQCKKLGLNVSELDDAQLEDPPEWANSKAVSERRNARLRRDRPR